MNLDLGPDTDELYNSLKRLSNSTAMNTIRLRRFAPKPIPFKEEPPKQLTFSLSQVYFTNGKPREDNEMKSEIDEIVGERRDLYKKAVRVIGTALENCVISDMISIDIDPESTRLPLMCKLMIIVEGACVERGQRVLVRDAAVQIGDTLDGTANIMNASSQTNGYDHDHMHTNKTNEIDDASLKARVARGLNNDGDDLSDQSSSSSRQLKLETKSINNENNSNKIKFTKIDRVSSQDENNNGVLEQPNFKIKIINGDSRKSAENGNNENSKLNGLKEDRDNNGFERSIRINTSSSSNNGRQNGGDVWTHESMLNRHRGSTGGMTSREVYEKREYVHSSGVGGGGVFLRHNRSSENLNHMRPERRQRRVTERTNQQSSVLERNACGGSLCNLPSQLVHITTSSANPNTTSTTTTTKSSYFSTRHADRASSSFVDSYLGLNEYLSTPYYQYQCKNRAKKDFANSTYEDAIELGISIPIQRRFINDDENFASRCFQMPVHRNEKHIFISNETTKQPFIDSSTIRTFAHNMRRYLHERLSRFEAEVTFFRLNNEEDYMPHFRITSPFHYMDCELCRSGGAGIGMLAPAQSSYAYQYHRRHHHHHASNFGASSSSPDFSITTTSSSSSSKSEPSVTNLMYVQVIDGSLNI